MYVTVRENNVDQALRVLKKKLQREGVFREMKNRRAYEKPSERRVREAAESTRRVRKLMRKRMEREGYYSLVRQNAIDQNVTEGRPGMPWRLLLLVESARRKAASRNDGNV